MYLSIYTYLILSTSLTSFFPQSSMPKALSAPSSSSLVSDRHFYKGEPSWTNFTHGFKGCLVRRFEDKTHMFVLFSAAFLSKLTWAS